MRAHKNNRAETVACSHVYIDVRPLAQQQQKHSVPNIDGRFTKYWSGGCRTFHTCLGLELHLDPITVLHWQTLGFMGGMVVQCLHVSMHGLPPSLTGLGAPNS